MKKQIMGIFIFCILLAGTFYYYYSIYKPKENYYFNVSISAKDKYMIKTGYEIQSGIGLIKGNTSKTYQVINLPSGMISIRNINLGKQDYYEEERNYSISKNTRIDLLLEEPDLPEIDKKYKDNLIILKIWSKNFKNVNFCLVGSINYLFLKAEPQKIRFFNLTNKKYNIEIRVDKYNYEDYKGFVINRTFYKDVEYKEINLEGFEDYDVCYKGDFSLKDSNKLLNISYLKLSTTKPDDFINISLIDSMGNTKIERIK